MTSNKNFEKIVNEYNNNVQSVIRQFFPAQNDIDDVKQEVYIKTWKNLSKFKGQSSLWGWMRTITLNTCKDQIQKNKKHTACLVADETYLETTPDNVISIDNKSLSSERQRLILSKINKLKPKFKQVLILHDIDEYTYEEIAQKLNCPIGTVKSRLFNARKLLKEELHSLI